jgi:hypothetical protein
LRAQVFADLATLDQGAPLTTWNELYERDPKTGQVRVSYKSPKRPFADLQWITASPAVECAAATHVWWLDMQHAGGDQTAHSVLQGTVVRERLSAQHAQARGGGDEPRTEQLARDYAVDKVRCVPPQAASLR